MEKINAVANTLDKQYTDLLQDILDNGVVKGDRTGTGTISVFSRQIRHKMSDGFPLLTTKKMPWKVIVTELIWFLRGDTNIQWLVQNGCNIWNGDAYKKYYDIECNPPHDHSHSQKEFIELIKTNDEFAKKWGELGPIYGAQWRNWGGYKNSSTKGILVQKADGWYVKWSDLHSFSQGTDWMETKLQKCDQSNANLVEGETVDFDFSVIKYNIDTFEPIREGCLINKPNKYTGGVDQISNLIKDLKENPDSRRLIVNAWNVGHIKNMTLPPCHYGFQCYTKELSYSERLRLLEKKYDKLGKSKLGLNHDRIEQQIDEEGIPKRELSLIWNQRSVDTFLGLPFNIASYGLLLEILAKEVNMVPGELIGNLGDTHLYLNHLDQAREQIGVEYKDEAFSEMLRAKFPEKYENYVNIKKEKIAMVKEQKYEEAAKFKDKERALLSDLVELVNKHSRKPYPLPTLDELPDYLCMKDDFECYEPDDFKLIGYKSHPTIKAPLSN